MGEDTITQELNYLRSKKYTKNKAEYLSKIFELTQAFCRKGKTADDVVNVLNSIYYKE